MVYAEAGLVRKEAMRHHGVRRLAMGAAAALALVACGDGSTGGPPPGSYNLQSGMLALVMSGETVAVLLDGSAISNGTSVPFQGSGTLTLAPGADGMFNGLTALLQTETISGTVSAAGQQLPYSSSVVNAYDGATGAILGESQAAEFDVASAPIAIPSMVGSSPMVLGTLNRYADDTQSVPLGTTQISVVVVSPPAPGPDDPEVVQFTFQSFDTTQTLVETDTVSYRLTEASVLSFASATAQNASGTVSVTLPAP
jgi:hypothetical protein